MFIVYDKETKCVQDHKRLKYICITIEDGKTARFSAPNMQQLIVNIEYVLMKNIYVECITSFCKKFLFKVTCNDCGDEVAEWISKYTINYFYDIS